MHADITPVVITYNEAANIGRVLERLRWARQVIVVDSFSSDETEAICRSFRNVRFEQRPFDGPANQLNHGADLAETEWILAMGADYVLTEELIAELGRLAPPREISAFLVSFRYCVFGRPLRATIYPAAPMLFRRSSARFVQDGHTERLGHPGAPGQLRGKIDHDDRKPLDRWLQSQFKYSAQECAKLLGLPPGGGRRQDRIRRWILPAPPLVFLYTLLWKGLWLDGWRGWFYAAQRALAELMISLRLLEHKLSRETPPPP